MNAWASRTDWPIFTGSYNARVDSTDRPLRILHLTAHSEPGGLSRYIYDLSLAMHQMGHDVRVAGNRGSGHRMFESAPFQYIELPLDQGPLQMWRAARALRRELAQRPVDVIHSHYRRTNWIARRLQHDRRPPLLYTLHLSDMPITWRAWLSNDYGDHVHVPAVEGQRWAVERAGVDAGRIALIPHGIHIDRYPRADLATRATARRALGVGDGDRVAAYVGRLDVPKNEDWLLDVAERSRESIPNLKLLVAGGGPHEAEFRRAIVQRRLEPRVIALGECDDPLPVYQAADALLLPSQREGFSLATAEAMSVGVPVCRTRTAGAAELIIENVTGRTTAIEREAFVAGAIALLSDGEALARMSPLAAAHIREHFTFERQLHQTIELYRRLAGIAEPASTPSTPARQPVPAEATRA
jgi:glycosyltransferase involved in cell wall biosynthesis